MIIPMSHNTKFKSFEVPGPAQIESVPHRAAPRGTAYGTQKSLLWTAVTSLKGLKNYSVKSL